MKSCASFDLPRQRLATQNRPPSRVKHYRAKHSRVSDSSTRRDKGSLKRLLWTALPRSAYGHSCVTQKYTPKVTPIQRFISLILNTKGYSTDEQTCLLNRSI